MFFENRIIKIKYNMFFLRKVVVSSVRRNYEVSKENKYLN